MSDEIHRSLGRIEGKLDQFLAGYDKDISDLKAGVQDYRTFKSKIMTVVAIVSAAFGAFSSQIASWFKSA